MSTYALLMCAPLPGLVALAAVTDWRSRRIPNWLTFSLALSGLAQSAVFGVICSPADSILGLLTGMALTLILYLLRAVQGGDVKLLAACGAWMGPLGAFQLFCIEAIVGAIIVIAEALARRRFGRLLSNTAVLAVNLAHVQDVGLDHVAATGQSSRSVEWRLPYAIPVLLALLILLAHSAIGIGG